MVLNRNLTVVRLFIAIDIPDELKRTLGSLRVEIPGLRWVPTSQIHLTLAFLGDVENAGVDQLAGELSRIHSPAFKLRFAGTGCFPDRRRPRVVWIGLEPEPRLRVLADKVRAAILACGIPLETRPFSPHITLARFKAAPSCDCDDFLDPRFLLRLPPFSVREFTLFQSRLDSHGAVHTPIKHFQLQ